MLTACGIETRTNHGKQNDFNRVATVLTACGIETYVVSAMVRQALPRCNSAYRLRY